MEPIYTVYVLFSEEFDKIYIGYTSDLISRFHSHNTKSKKGWTKSFRPWIVVYSEYYENKADAINREKELKTSKGRDFVRTYISNNY